MKKIKIVAGGSPSEAALEAGGDSQIGVVTACCWTWDLDTPKSQAFAKAYWEEFKAVPPSQAAQAYTGAMLLFNAIEKAGSTEPKKIAEALKGATYEGPYRLVRISPKDNSMRTPAFLGQNTGGPGRRPIRGKGDQENYRSSHARRMVPGGINRVDRGGPHPGLPRIQTNKTTKTLGPTHKRTDG